MERLHYNNELEQIFFNNTDRLINKWSHYFEIYDRHFSRFRNKEIVILEIGIFQGGSLQMWKKYFGDKAKIYGVDIDPRCKEFEEENIEIHIGSQSDPEFLEKLKSAIPKIDILIDDGGHTMNQMRVTFDHMFDHIKSDGVYLCEDTHTCYQWRYGGGYKRSNSFIEYTKNIIDYLHAWHSEQKALQINKFTRSIHSIHFYDSIILIEKRNMVAPSNLKVGKPSFNYDETSTFTFSKKVKKGVNLLLQYFRLPSIGID
ncbi:MAG: class I SAM-dependent methyltransferase [Alphaproteobacteria bacterium]|nr:MAG: class I SAM-dependent methyltransferase [Alphaproteobacteria bacterium]